MNRPLLKVENLHVHYGKIHAIQGINFEIVEGEILTIIGSNGAGKTTTLGALSGLHPPSSGRILFEGNPIGGLRPHKIVSRGISLSPEGRFIFPGLTVAENLSMGAHLRKDKEAVARDRDDLFTLFPRLKERIHQAGGTLSGGEQQMLAIARACMARPKLLLLDEPSLGLAPLLVKDIFENILEINRRGSHHTAGGAERPCRPQGGPTGHCPLQWARFHSRGCPGTPSRRKYPKSLLGSLGAMVMPPRMTQTFPFCRPEI